MSGLQNRSTQDTTSRRNRKISNPCLTSLFTYYVLYIVSSFFFKLRHATYIGDILSWIKNAILSPESVFQNP